MELNEQQLTMIRDALNTEVANLVLARRWAAASEHASLRELVQNELNILQGERARNIA